MSMKNSNDTIGNRTRNLPTCSAVPRPTAPPPLLKSVPYLYGRMFQRSSQTYTWFLIYFVCSHKEDFDEDTNWHFDGYLMRGKLHKTVSTTTNTLSDSITHSHKCRNNPSVGLTLEAL